MIREFIVCPGQLQFWHVAGHALLRGHFADFRARFSTPVASDTFYVVIRGFAAHFVMRIVAREAADSRVVRVVAFASRKTVWLEANIRNAGIFLQCNLFPGPVTLPAEVGGLLGRHAVQF